MFEFWSRSILRVQCGRGLKPQSTSRPIGSWFVECIFYHFIRVVIHNVPAIKFEAMYSIVTTVFLLVQNILHYVYILCPFKFRMSVHSLVVPD